MQGTGRLPQLLPRENFFPSSKGGTREIVTRTFDLCLDTALPMHTSPETPRDLLEVLSPSVRNVRSRPWWQGPDDITLAEGWASVHTDRHLSEV